MRLKSDKTCQGHDCKESAKKHQAKKARVKRSAAIARSRGSQPKKEKPGIQPPAVQAGGYDPEMLYVECARCGAPVLWEAGRATSLLAQAGIDPLELDATCMLLTDACPACGAKEEYSVRIFRISDHNGSGNLPPFHGHS